MDDGGEDALVVFYANILAMTYSRVVAAADTCDFANLIAGDVQAVTFGFQMGAELSVACAKIHFVIELNVKVVNIPLNGSTFSRNRYCVSYLLLSYPFCTFALEKNKTIKTLLECASSTSQSVKGDASTCESKLSRCKPLFSTSLSGLPIL